jgi:hypothetical protein
MPASHCQAHNDRVYDPVCVIVTCDYRLRWDERQELTESGNRPGLMVGLSSNASETVSISLRAAGRGL